MTPDPPRGQGPRGLVILCPGVKLRCPPVQNLNEPPDSPINYWSLKSYSECVFFTCNFTRSLYGHATGLYVKEKETPAWENAVAKACKTLFNDH